MTCANSGGESFPYYGNTHRTKAGWDNFYWPSNWASNPGCEHDAENHIYLDEVEIFSDMARGDLALGPMADGASRLAE